MELVKNWNDILKNVLMLEKYRNSADQVEVEYYEGMIRRGTCFVVTEVDGRLVFSPSRFIGYLNNDRLKHDSNTMKDGRVTNPQIEAITCKKFRVNETLEKEYRKFCRSLGFEPNDKGSFGVIRKYILQN